MKRYILTLVVILFGSIFLIGCSETDESGELEREMAETFITQLDEGEYEEAFKNFDETMKAEITPEGLEEIWETLVGQIGQFIDQEFDSIKKTDSAHNTVFIKGLFEADEVTFIITFNKDEQIAGFYVQ